MEEIKFENFNISENNIISVKLAKVLGGYWTCCEGGPKKMGARGGGGGGGGGEWGWGMREFKRRGMWYLHIYIPTYLFICSQISLEKQENDVVYEGNKSKDT